MQPIIDSIDTVTEVVTGIFTLMVANPLLTFFLAAAIVGVGVEVFTQIRGAAK